MPLVDEYAMPDMELSNLIVENKNIQGTKVVAMDCEMVGGGSDGSLDLCALLCLVDEDENVIFHSYVQPQIPVTNYRHEITGITEDHLVHANSVFHVSRKIQEILYNGEPPWRARMEGGKARILVGHSLEHDLDCLQMDYPDHLIRDTSKYRPLMKTNLISHSLKYLTKTYLGYVIQAGHHNPYEDCVAALRLYKRMRSQIHSTGGLLISEGSDGIGHPSKKSVFDSWSSKLLENLTHDALLAMSVSNYRCWCLDRTQALKSGHMFS